MAARKPRRRRSAGEGGAYAYKLADGTVRYRVKGQVRQADGSVKEVNLRKGPNGEQWTTETDALAWLHDQQAAGRKGEYIEPSRQRLGAYARETVDGMRLKGQTRASYLKNLRLHVDPYPLADLPLGQVTGQRLTAHYRVLERSGRKDHRAGEGLSPRTVRYIHAILHGVLDRAVKDSLLIRNPAAAAVPPTAGEAKAPEMHPWNAVQLDTFLRWAEQGSEHYRLWFTLAYTGMRLGEALALRWRDITLDTATLTVRRSAGIVRIAGQSAEVVENSTKTGKARVIDLDPDTVTELRAHKAARGSMALPLAKPDALVFGDMENAHRNGAHVWRQFTTGIVRCRKELGLDAAELPVIRVHDLRHTHATLLLLARVPVHVVSQRLGHASPVITMGVYAHVLPGSQREAADTFAQLIRGARSA